MYVRKEPAVVQTAQPQISLGTVERLGPGRRIFGRLRETSSTCGCKAFANNRSSRLGSGGNRDHKKSIGVRSLSGLQARNRRYFERTLHQTLGLYVCTLRQVLLSTHNIGVKEGEASFIASIEACSKIIDDEQVSIRTSQSLAWQICLGRQAR
ncbi:uncharacterized protein PgNI_08726 [Pyricularia grisea]|uniref:Uncharacterized protein n=1 Tax=Pyricularia grisea TaxID=148305 RepID=A0A6P8AUD4_PYRGI|nr:uncharacterized protein PgNI_08726 [Pyricularia grisea]TLD05774.1 hypothetical protein PgNI_08726 [Pyricularia grisea]